ncbi:MAG: FAD-binding oxidoreductase [Alphaproteobacteria bacterium]|nr:FAD-binding oxidoreductase [Alphaproteobacteria bacterium]
MRDGLRLSGLVEFAGLDAPPDFRKARRMLDKAKALFPGISVTGGQFWMGHRPSMPDSMPVIGRTHARSKVLLAFGHGHQGVGFAAITGKVIASLIDGAPTPVDIAPFSPMRFGGFS